jgi:hypothetical protein
VEKKLQALVVLKKKLVESLLIRWIVGTMKTCGAEDGTCMDGHWVIGTLKTCIVEDDTCTRWQENTNSKKFCS